MKRDLIKVLVCIVTFFVSLYVISAIMNRGNSDMTMEMSDASQPLVYINYEGTHINCMHGYASEMDISFMNDMITPVGSDRTVALYVDRYSCVVSGISYEVRSIDGERLIENGDVYDYIDMTSAISFEITLKDLIDADEEYELIILLDVDGQTLRYYTRIIQRSENYAGEEIRFVKDFSAKTFDKEAATELTTYIEPDETGDNTTYAAVNIHSSFSQLTWGNLDVAQVTDPEIVVTEYFAQTIRVKMSYYVEVATEDEVKLCRVEEFYRIRYGTQRMYLLDFERTMNEVFEMDVAQFTSNKIDLGISHSDIEMMESEDGGVFAFVSENRLFYYNSSSNRFAQLFAFYDEEHMDVRTYFDQSDIEILSVDETGNVEFMVYGYMNRGTHEGTMGIAVYSYNNISNTVEERAFIPYDKSFAVLQSDLEQLVYLNASDQLFIYLSGNVFQIDLTEQRYTAIISGLSQENFCVSESGRFIAWMEEEDEDAWDVLQVINLSSGEIQEIEAGNHKTIRPLGFMGEDLIYGLSKNSDVYTDVTGSKVYPMFAIKIMDGSTGELTMTYQKSNLYVESVTVVDNQINLTRLVKLEDGYASTTEDQIMSNATSSDNANTVSVVATESLEKIVQISCKSTFTTKSLKFLTPKEVVYEGSNQLMLEYPEQTEEYYYVYGADGIIGVYTDGADAILKAESDIGTVRNGAGDYIWYKGNRSTSNQIMKIEAAAADEDTSSLAVCLNTLLSYEGISRNCQRLLNQGKSVMTILEEQMSDAVILNLSGCSLDSVLYYVNKDIPVLALLDNDQAVLIIGFNELNTVLMDPETGTIYKKGINDSTEFFAENGNRFITYVR